MLVPLDGSEAAERAIPVARALATRLGATVDVVAVGRSQLETDELRTYLALLTPRLDFAFGSCTLTEAPDPATQIALTSSLRTETLVCMATHGHGRSAAFIGSKTESVLRSTHRSVLVVGPQAALGGRSHSVTVCLDGTAESTAGIEEGASWAAALHATLRLVTVVEPAPARERVAEHPEKFAPSGDPAAYLTETAAAAPHPPQGIRTTVFEDPMEPVTGLLAHLQTEPAQLLVVTSRIRAGIGRAVLGSFAAHLAHWSPVPVLVVPRI